LPDSLKRSWKNVDNALLFKIDEDTFYVTKAKPKEKAEITISLEREFPKYIFEKENENKNGLPTRECEIAPMKETLVAASMLAKEVIVYIEKGENKNNCDTKITSDLAKLSNSLGFRLDAFGGKWKCYFAPVSRTLDELVDDSVNLVKDYIDRASRICINEKTRFKNELKSIHTDLSLTGECTMDHNYNDAIRLLAINPSPSLKCAFEKMLLIKCCEAMLDELFRILDYTVYSLEICKNEEEIMNLWHKTTTKPFEICSNALRCYVNSKLDENRRTRLFELLRHRKERFETTSVLDFQTIDNEECARIFWMVKLLCERIVMLSGTAAATIIHFQRFA